MLATCDIYGLANNTSDINDAYARFVLKLVQNFPVVEQEVIGIVGENLVLDVGRNASIKKGMKFVAYHRDEPFYDSESGEILVKGEVVVDGLLKVKKVTDIETVLEPVADKIPKNVSNVVTQ